MSDELVRSLNNQIGSLRRKLAELRIKARDASQSKATTKTEAEKLAAQLSELKAERDELKVRVDAAPSDDRKRADEYMQKYQSVLHKTAFARKVREKNAGASDQVIDDLWSLSGYKAEGEAPNDARISEVVESLAKSRPYAFAAPVDANSTKTKLPPGPGAGRGAPAGAEMDGKVVVRRSDTSDYAWMKANRAKIAEAQAAGTLVITDD